jgi:hypothetical protein
MLNQYIRRVQRLIRDVRQQVINPGDIIDYINEARRQVAGEGQCIRVLGTFNTVVGIRQTAFSAFTLEGTGGSQGPLAVRTGWLQGTSWLHPETWEDYSLYDFNNPLTGPPQRWAQFGEGAAGFVFLAPIPNAVYPLTFDCACYPIDLVTDTTIEAIPLLWTDAVPYYATYLALLSMESGGASEQSDKMFQRYREYVVRARVGTTPGVLPWQLPQVPVPGGINPPPGRGGG